MYSKYEEMSVMKQVIENYAYNQKLKYESIIANLKEKSNNFSLNINSNRVNLEISSLQTKVSLLSDYLKDYQSALSVVREFNKAMMYYEQAYSLKQLLPGEIADQKVKESNRIFHDIRTQNPEYKRIIDEIAYDLFISHDPHLDGLKMDFDAKAESLEKDFSAGKITKKQLIYYTNMCSSLSRNPDYIEYMSQFQQQENQGMHI
ncbi:MAG: hypothetical protein IJB83_01165 [Bacilli bacterium]|nr:hypothetical protein [Bacilli bacterium]